MLWDIWKNEKDPKNQKLLTDKSAWRFEEYNVRENIILGRKSLKIDTHLKKVLVSSKNANFWIIDSLDSGKIVNFKIPKSSNNQKFLKANLKPTLKEMVPELWKYVQLWTNNRQTKSTNRNSKTMWIRNWKTWGDSYCTVWSTYFQSTWTKNNETKIFSGPLKYLMEKINILLQFLSVLKKILKV